MRNIRIILLLIIMSVCGFGTKAQEFMSAEAPAEIITIGFRAGVNSSIRTFGKDYFRKWNVDSWGSGIDLGFVLDLNMRDFFSIQPGIFFESRSGSYAYATNYYDYLERSQDFTQMGRYRTYSMVVPVMFSFHFNLSQSVRWTAEAGPYGQLWLHSTDKDKIIVPNLQLTPSTVLHPNVAKARIGDAGLKIGSGLTLNRKYSFYIHYLGGFRKAWRYPHLGGRNKAWTFTVGYEL